MLHSFTKTAAKLYSGFKHAKSRTICPELNTVFFFLYFSCLTAGNEHVCTYDSTHAKAQAVLYCSTGVPVPLQVPTPNLVHCWVNAMLISLTTNHCWVNAMPTQISLITNFKHPFTTSFLQLLPHLITPQISS